MPPDLSRNRDPEALPFENCIAVIMKPVANTRVRSSPRPISTARLHTLLRFYLRPINHIIYVGSYLVNPVGELIFRWASNLDAFSFYPLRTQLPGMYRWRDNPYTGGPSVPVLSY